MIWWHSHCPRSTATGRNSGDREQQHQDFKKRAVENTSCCNSEQEVGDVVGTHLKGLCPGMPQPEDPMEKLQSAGLGRAKGLDFPHLAADLAFPAELSYSGCSDHKALRMLSLSEHGDNDFPGERLFLLQ